MIILNIYSYFSVFNYYRLFILKTYNIKHIILILGQTRYNLCRGTRNSLLLRGSNLGFETTG